MFVKLKNQVSFLSGFKRIYETQGLHYKTIFLGKAKFRRKKTDTFFYNHSESMLKMTVEIFFNRMFCFSSFLEI